MASIVCELTWLHFLTHNFLIAHSQAALFFSYNKTAILIVFNPVSHECTKLTEIDCHLISEKIQADLICTLHATSASQLVDIFTKPLGFLLFTTLLHKIGILDIYSPA